MSFFKKGEIKLIIMLFFLTGLFYKIVTMNDNDEDIRRKELRMKYYL